MDKEFFFFFGSCGGEILYFLYNLLIFFCGFQVVGFFKYIY